MKRILALILVSIMLILVLISCGNEIDTDTNTDTDMDNTQDEIKLTPTINSFDEIKKTEYSYYEMIDLGRYLGSELPMRGEYYGASEKWNGYHYKAIKSYEELSALVEHPTAIQQEIFEDNFVLALGYITNSTGKDSVGKRFFGLTYSDSEGLFIEVHRISSIVQSSDVLTVNSYFIIPKNQDGVDSFYDKISSGEITVKSTEINEGKYDTISLYSDELDSEKFEMGACYVSTNVTEISELISGMLIDGIVDICDFSEPNNAYILISNKKCSCVLGYKDFYIDGDTVHITQESFEHKESCKDGSIHLDLVMVDIEGIENEITKNTRVKVLIEERVNTYKTNYYLDPIHEVYMGGNKIEHNYYSFIEDYEATEKKIEFPEKLGRYFKIISTYEELQNYITAPKTNATVFENNYVLALNIHEYWTYYGLKIIGFKDFICDNGQYKINMDYYQSYQDIDFIEAEQEHNLTYYLLIPKENVTYTEEIKEIEWVLTEKETVATNYLYHTESTPLYNAPTSFVADYDSLLELGFEHIYRKASYVVLYLPYELKGDFVITDCEIRNGHIYLYIDNYLHKNNVHLSSFDSKYFYLYAGNEEDIPINEDYRVYITINQISVPTI